MTIIVANISVLHATNDHKRPAFAPDSVHHGMAILYIGTISADCYPDTVWGARGGTIDAPTYLPKVIVWGQYDKTGLRGRRDSAAQCKGHVADHLRVPYTIITYPDWGNLRVSLTAMTFNPEDTLADLLIAVRGTVGEAQSQHDTSRVLLVWGQSALITLDTIRLGTVSDVQIEPFAAMELRKGADIANEKRRDLSGRNSYEVHRAGFRERDADTNRLQNSIAAGVIRVYPNPTAIAAQVEGRSIPAGEYSVEIVAVNGEVTHKLDVTVRESGSLFETFDVAQLPTGYYIVRLGQHGKAIGTFPIVVTH